MENKKEFLTEENYEKGKKKLKNIALIILIVGMVIGLGLIITGAVLSSNAKGMNIDLNPEQENTEVLRSESEVQADINTIKPKVSSLESQLLVLETELSQIQLTEGLTDKYYAKLSEKETKETELLNLKTELENYKTELAKIKNNTSKDEFNSQLNQFEGLFNNASENVAKAKYAGYYIFGAFIMIGSGIISLALYLFAKRREITAFTVQQTMPLAQEGIEKMAPTVGGAVGTIGKEIAKGIKEGINEANENSNEE